jgi:hypothetical protein
MHQHFMGKLAAGSISSELLKPHHRRRAGYARGVELVVAFLEEATARMVSKAS